MDDSIQANKKALYCEYCKTHSIVDDDYYKCLSCFNTKYVKISQYKVIDLECKEELEVKPLLWCMKCGKRLDNKVKRYFGGLTHYCLNDNEITQLTLREPHYEAYTRNFRFELAYFPYTLERLCKKVINKYNLKTPWPKHSWINNTT